MNTTMKQNKLTKWPMKNSHIHINRSGTITEIIAEFLETNEQHGKTVLHIHALWAFFITDKTVKTHYTNLANGRHQSPPADNNQLHYCWPTKNAIRSYITVYGNAQYVMRCPCQMDQAAELLKLKGPRMNQKNTRAQLCSLEVHQ
jgi:hypothetical protein